MERNIGEVFNFNIWRLKAQENEIASCNGCFLYDNSILCMAARPVAGSCCATARNDHKNIIFVEVKDNEGNNI